MFWLIAAIASAGLGSLSIVALLRRMDANIERVFRDAPDLEGALVDGAYGKVTGRITSTTPTTVPELGTPCLMYELEVYQGQAGAWRMIERSVIGDELVVEVGNARVTFSAKDARIVIAPSYDSAGRSGTQSLHVRYVPVDAVVTVVGRLVLEIDQDPAATTDYREIATRYRLVGMRGHPIVLGVAEPRAPSARGRDRP